jgi:tripartite-type tricarboxylate transporter receptor subunit TctC
MKKIIFACGLACLHPGPASAADLYAGKTITIMVGLAAGGGFDVYARYLARHWSKHIPGAPRIVVENKPGAASSLAAFHVYRVAPKDGTVIGMNLEILPLYQALFPERLGFDMSKVHWIGNMATLNSVIAISDRSPVKSVADMTTHTAILGSNGVLSQTYIVPSLLNSFNDAKFKIVLGFPGTSQIDLAIERGEVDGRGGQWTSFVMGRPDWIKNGKIKPLIQIGVTDDPLMEGAPQLTSLAKDEKSRAIYQNISSNSQLSRAIWVAPEVPDDRVNILRTAFEAAMKDPDLLAEASKSQLEISPTMAADITAAVKQIADTPQAYLQVLREMLKDQK